MKGCFFFPDQRDLTISFKSILTCCSCCCSDLSGAADCDNGTCESDAASCSTRCCCIVTRSGEVWLKWEGAEAELVKY